MIASDPNRGSRPIDHPITGTVKRADLARRVRALGYSADRAAELVGAVCDALCDGLEAGETIKLYGFGRFDVVHKGARPVRNPKTGGFVALPARRTVTFRPAQGVRKALTAALQLSETTRG